MSEDFFKKACGKFLDHVAEKAIVEGESAVMVIDHDKYISLERQLAEVTKALEDQGNLVKLLVESNVQLAKERDQWRLISFRENDKRKALENWQTKAREVIENLQSKTEIYLHLYPDDKQLEAYKKQASDLLEK